MSNFPFPLRPKVFHASQEIDDKRHKKSWNPRWKAWKLVYPGPFLAEKQYLHFLTYAIAGAYPAFSKNAHQVYRFFAIALFFSILMTFTVFHVLYTISNNYGPQTKHPTA